MAKKTTKKISESNTIELALPKFDSEEGAKGLDEVWERFPVTIDKITDWFKQ
jgi:hypothetical protein